MVDGQHILSSETGDWRFDLDAMDSLARHS